MKRQNIACIYVGIALIILFFSNRIIQLIMPVIEPVIKQALPGGLQVSYYAGTHFERLVCKRTERKVDRYYGKEKPARGVPKDHFSAIWAGYLIVPADDTYYFKIQSDDGSRLSIDGEVVIDNWKGRRFLPKVAKKWIKKGKHPVKIEYYDEAGDARLRLKWNGEKTEIPSGTVLAAPFISKR